MTGASGSTEKPEDGSAPGSSGSVLGRRPGLRKWAFRIAAATLVPLVFFGLLEGGLRLFGYGYSTRFFVRAKGRDVCAGNSEFGLRFFPPALNRPPLPLLFPVDKEEGAFRIFILGASAARGEPDPAFGFSRILEVMLKAQYPQKRFEVINTAMTAINSHVVLPIARDCARRDADLFVVYLGNNEVVGPYGAGTVLKAYSPSLKSIRAGIRVKSTKLGQLLEAVVGRLSGRYGEFDEWTGMEMFEGHKVPADDPRMEKVYDHFRRNLEDIYEVARAAGAKLIVCTVATNVKDNAPFASLHKGGLTTAELEKWEGTYKEGIHLQEQMEYRGALERFREALAIDDLYADLHFRLGMCTSEMNEPDAARKHYISARDLDALRFRADSRINRIIRETAYRRELDGIHLVDVARAFEKSSKGLPGEELFHEHVHMNFDGNYLLARSVFLKVVGLAPAWIRDPTRGKVTIPPRDRCASRLALTGLNRLKIELNLRTIRNKAPFTNQLDFEEKSAQWERKRIRLEKEVQTPQSVRQTCAVYREAVARVPDDLFFRQSLAALLMDVRDWSGAAEHFGFLLERTGLSPSMTREAARAHLELGKISAAQAKTPEAKEHFEKGLRLAEKAGDRDMEREIKKRLDSCRNHGG